MSNIIFVRERRKVEKGEKRPRFRVVGTIGDIRIVAEHIVNGNPVTEFALEVV